MRSHSNYAGVIAFAFLLGLQLCLSAELAPLQSLQPPTTVSAGAAQPHKRSYAEVAATNPRMRQIQMRQSDNTLSTIQHNEFKELMSKLQDRVGILASLAEDQRNRLESIDKKLVQFEQSNLARLDSIAAQQTDFEKRVDVLEHLQRLTKTALDTVAGEKHVKIQKGIKYIDDIKLSRATRQVDASRIGADIDDIFNEKPQPNVTQKLDALATLLTSTAITVHDLRSQLAVNITKLTHTTSVLQRRLNGHKRRQQQQQQYGLTSYLPPLQGAPQLTATSCVQSEQAVNGIQKLQLTSESETFYVRCEDDWTLILNRNSDNVNFERDWLEYKAGFGNLAGEFFIGLEKLHALTSSAVHELRVVLEDFGGQVSEARYSLFGIASEHELYALNLLGEYSGDAGDSLSYHAGSKFSTFDHDNDGCLDCNCAHTLKGGWWFNWCLTSNLHGQYIQTVTNSTPSDQGIIWSTFPTGKFSLAKAKMLIRPVAADEERR